jgi:hypothetical protein
MWTQTCDSEENENTQATAVEMELREVISSLKKQIAEMEFNVE